MARILKKLGHGAFGDVYLLHLSSGNGLQRKTETFALKVADTSKLPTRGEGKGEAEKEAKLMIKLCHAHLVQCCAYSMKGRYLYLVTEFCRYGTLKNYIKQRTSHVAEEKVLTWLAQMADALRHIHALKVIHRDLKTDNIFLDENETVKIGDLGIAKELEYTLQSVKTMIGTLCYMAPEIINGSSYSFQVDIWSLGCCVHEVMTRHHTFTGKHYPELMHNITKGSIPKMPKMFGESLQNLVLTLLDRNPDTRPDATKVLFKVCGIRGCRYKSGSHKPLESIDVSAEVLDKAVQDFECHHFSEEAPISTKLKSQRNSRNEKKEEYDDEYEDDFEDEDENEESSDEDTYAETVRHEPRPLPARKTPDQAVPEAQSRNARTRQEKVQGHNVQRHSTSVSQSSQKTSQGKKRGSVSQGLKKEGPSQLSSPPVARQEEESFDATDFTLQSTLTETEPYRGTLMDKDYMDVLARESVQWLRTRFAPKEDQSRLSDGESSSDSESLVTLYTRAQKVKYVNTRSRLRKQKTGTVKQCDLESEVAPDVIKAAESVVRLFATQGEKRIETMLIHVMGLRDYTVHGQTLVDRVMAAA